MIVQIFFSTKQFLYPIKRFIKVSFCSFEGMLNEKMQRIGAMRTIVPFHSIFSPTC